MTLARLYLYFIITAFIGYIYECIAMTLWSGKWENRGYMLGPMIPIYGVGCLLGYLTFGDLIRNYTPLTVFLIGFVMSAVLEYPTSLILEKVFHTRWWDYSIGPFNIEGRVSLLSSLGFGIGAVLIVYVLNPLLIPLVKIVPQNIAHWLSIIIAVIFVTDFFAVAYCTLHKITPGFITRYNDIMSRAVRKINPQEKSLYRFLKKHTNWFK
ncbi:MAG: putative ABC transporter permease [Erysipelotrichaceae bacterium]|nr:putative ABC transporter permease [Erysipelotrichaceae bacterium]